MDVYTLPEPVVELAVIRTAMDSTLGKPTGRTMWEIHLKKNRLNFKRKRGITELRLLILIYSSYSFICLHSH